MQFRGIGRGSAKAKSQDYLKMKQGWKIAGLDTAGLGLCDLLD
jgi:hypothetical protein